jgi:NACHT domain
MQTLLENGARIYEVAAGLYARHKEIALLMVGGFVTFVFTRCLPWIFQSGSNIGTRALGRVSSRFRRRVALGEYLNWVILQNRDLNLTGIVGAAEKPQLEQVFISVKIHPAERPTEPPAAPLRQSWAVEALGLLKLDIAFLRSRLGRLFGSSAGSGGCATVFSPKLFPSRRFVRLRRWADRYNFFDILLFWVGFVLVMLWPAWSVFLNHSANTLGSGWAGLIWTSIAAAGVAVVRDRDADIAIKASGSVLAAVFGGAVLAAIAMRTVHHDPAPLALIATSAFAIVGIVATTSMRVRASAPGKDTHELGRLLHSDNIAILGKPGSGKSTLIQFLALTFGQAKAGERRLKRRGVLRRRLGTTGWLMPIPIPLRKIAAFVESADPNVVGNLVVEAFRRKILPSGVRDKCDAAFFLRMIAARKCIFLFDGLDEVSEDNQSQALIREILGLVSQYSGNKFLITSRYAGWRGGVGSSFKMGNSGFVVGR